MYSTPFTILLLLRIAYAQLPCSNLPALFNTSSLLKVISSTHAAAGTINVTGALANTLGLCQVRGDIQYALNDSMAFELWLPDQWTGRFVSVGNDGYAGFIDRASIATYANLGHAVVGGDSGHDIAANSAYLTSSDEYVPFLWDPQQTVAWPRDAIAILTGPTRDLTTLFYGKRPMYSYYAGCSAGGAQGFALAQYHPHLYDGILAGSPGNWFSHLILSFLWNFRHTQNASFLSQDALDFVTNRTLDACDSLDGVEDRLIENPLECYFNVSTLACSPSQQPVLNNTVQCLTSAQLTALQSIYSGPVSGTTQLYPGFSPGSESGFLYQENFLAPTFSYPMLANTVFKDIGYNASTFDFDTDVVKVDSTASPLIDSISPDLLEFKFHGGKMLITQGWAD